MKNCPKCGHDPSRDLTERQHRIAVLAAKGSTTREIAYEMGIADKTVASHLFLIYRKLGISNTALGSQRVLLSHHAIKHDWIKLNN